MTVCWRPAASTMTFAPIASRLLFPPISRSVSQCRVRGVSLRSNVGVSFMFTTSDTLSTLPVGLGKIIIGDVQPWGELMAAALMTALPVVILYMIGQKFMVAGLTAGSVKG